MADRAYVYEFGGAPSGYAALWQEICAARRTIYINERSGSAAQLWLSAMPGIIWREPALASRCKRGQKRTLFDDQAHVVTQRQRCLTR